MKASRLKHNSRKGRHSHWISKPRRHAIYARDNNRCVYCLSAAQGAHPLTLDHLSPRIKGGGHESRNLVTACHRCNSARGDRSVRSFCIAVAHYLGVDWRLILFRVKATARRKLHVDRKQADTKRTHRVVPDAVRAVDREPQDSAGDSGCVVLHLPRRVQVPAEVARKVHVSGRSPTPIDRRAVEVAEQALAGWVSRLGDAAGFEDRVAAVRGAGLVRSE